MLAKRIPGIANIVLGHHLLYDLQALGLCFLEFAVLCYPGAGNIPLKHGIHTVTPRAVLLQAADEIAQIMGAPYIVNIAHHHIQVRVLSMVKVVDLTALKHIIGMAKIGSQRSLYIYDLCLLFVI